MSVAVGDTVRLTAEAQDVLDELNVPAEVGQEFEVTSTTSDYRGSNPLVAMFAPEGAIWIDVNDPRGPFGLSPAEYELVA